MKKQQARDIANQKKRIKHYLYRLEHLFDGFFAVMFNALEGSNIFAKYFNEETMEED